MRMISEEELEEGRTAKGGWNRTALAQWGVPWPPPVGWKHTLLKHGVPYQADKGKKSDSGERPVLCRNCYIPLNKIISGYFCERCGLTWNQGGKDDASSTYRTNR